MKRAMTGAALAALLCALPAAANDSTAELAAGGLVLKTTDSIEMRSEDLFISQDAVVVKYRFANTSAKDVTTVVAFPMPDLGGVGFFESDNGIPSQDPINLLDFATMVDGRPVKASVEQKALVGGVDRSAWLVKRGVPLAEHLDGARRALDNLSDADKAEAVKLGLATVDEYDQGQGWEKHLAPAWVLKTTFYWTQTFPAGRELAIDHRYTPAVGGSVDTIVGSEMWRDNTGGHAAEARAKYCVDKGFEAAVAKGRAKASGDDGFSAYQERRIAYVLKTGGNWAKPIGAFRLVVDKGAADNLVSFCATGVKKIGPTRFEVVKTNYRPAADLDILILVPQQRE
jgi:hypothetical protein